MCRFPSPQLTSKSLPQTVSYEADERGFKPHISYEETEDASARSGGYDSNANNVRSSDFANGAGGFQNGGHHDKHGAQHGGHGNARSNGY